MLIDVRSLPQGETIETEVCIIGAGPAGLSLAQEFIGQGFRVCLLETGGLEPDHDVQNLSLGETTGDAYNGLEVFRRRQVGGMSNEWSIELSPTQRGLRYTVLDEVDFEQRDWLPYSGWPFDYAHLKPYYDRAHQVCKIGPLAYDADTWTDADNPPLPLVGDRVHTTMFQFGAGEVFHQTYRDQIIQSQNVTLCLYANAVELETDDSAQTVQRVRVACLSGNQVWIAAKIVAITAGGIESARLLLLSNQTQMRGLGNQHDQVGRFFMDHPLVCTGEFVPTDRQLFNQTALYDRRVVNGTHVMGKLALTNEVMRREQLLNMSGLMYPRYPIYQSPAARSLKKLLMTQYKYLMRSSASEGVASLQQMVESVQQGKSLGNTLSHLQTAAAGMGDIALAAYRKLIVDPLRPNIPADLGRCGWSEWQQKERKFGYFEVWSQTEQTPDPDNRLTLSDQRDRLGCPKAKLHWRWSESDQQQVQRAQKMMAEALQQSGLGELKLYQDGDRPLLMSPTTHHHIGTTRMHVDPKQGVVDADCKVHGVSNLFIASSSVFPTGGYANPTLTIVALAIRLADRIKTSLS